jgi:hypothetical protein
MKQKLLEIYSFDFLKLEFKAQLWKYLAINVMLFLVPLLLGQPQLLIGTFVNFMLIYIAVNYKHNEMLPAIFLPALATVLRDTLLGPATMYLAVLMPFIWIGNALFILSIRNFLIQKTKPLKLFVLSSVFKSAFLFVITLLLVALFKFPTALLLAMGGLQIVTALAASVIYLVFFKRSLLKEEHVS